MEIGVGCRHRDVEWKDADHCRCHECGKAGEWFEDGFMLWRRLSRAQQTNWNAATAIASCLPDQHGAEVLKTTMGRGSAERLMARGA